MKKKLLALIFVSLLGLSACTTGAEDPLPPVTNENTTQATTQKPEATTAEPPVVTTEPPEATTEPLPPFEPIPIPDTVESQGGSYVTDGNHIYFADPLNGYALTRMNMDLSDPVVLDRWNCTKLYLDHDFLYYNAINPDVSLRTSPWPDLRKMELATDTIADLMPEASLIGITEDRILVNSSENRLYSIRKDGLDAMELVLGHEEFGGNYEILDGYLYFTCLSDDDSIAGLYRIPITGGEPERVLDGYPNWVISADGKLYFTHYAPIDWSQVPYDDVPPITYILYELSSDRTLRAIAEKIDNFGHLEIADGWAYYADYAREGPFPLYRIKLDSGENTLLYEGETVSGIEVVGGFVFFSTYTYGQDYRIEYTTFYSMTLDGSKGTELGKTYPAY